MSGEPLRIAFSALWRAELAAEAGSGAQGKRWRRQAAALLDGVEAHQKKKQKSIP